MSEIKVRYRNGVFEPLEKLDLPEGTEGKVLVELAEPTFFDMAREISERVAATGISDEELEDLINEAVHEVRRETYEALKRGERPGTIEEIIDEAVEAVRQERRASDA